MLIFLAKLGIGIIVCAALALFAEVAFALIVGKCIAPDSGGDDKDDSGDAESSGKSNFSSGNKGYDIAASLIFFANAAVAAFFAIRLMSRYGLFK